MVLLVFKAPVCGETFEGLERGDFDSVFGLDDPLAILAYEGAQ